MKTKKSFLYLFAIIFTISLASCGTTKKQSNKDFYSYYSKKLGINLTGKEDKKLIKTVASWKGTPYKYGGTSKSGTDCSGFVGSVYREVYGKKLHRTSRDMIKDVRKIYVVMPKRNTFRCEGLCCFIFSVKITSAKGRIHN